MVHQHDGELKAALEFAKKGEQRRHLSGDVLVHPMQPDEWVEDEKPWLQLGDGLREGFAILLEVEAHGRGGDDLDIEVSQRGARGAADAIEALADDVQRVLRREEEDRPGAGHGEVAEAGLPGGDRDGHVEGQE